MVSVMILRSICCLVLLCGVLVAQDDVPDPEPPRIAAASNEGQSALSGFKVRDDLRGQLFAAEPLIANPVAFYVDNTGKVYVCESYRQGVGVTDNRKHDQKWLDDDLAAQTVEDRIAYGRD